MSQSPQFQSNNFEDFNDSILIKPISLKPTIPPAILQRGNPQNTILGIYDNIKLTEYIHSSQYDTIIQLLTIDKNSSQLTLGTEAIDFFQRYSATNIAFVIVTGNSGSGKSFFIDKILNLSNVQGNHFSMYSKQPAINIWSAPFVKEDLTFFIGQVSGCSPDSPQFQLLLPYVVTLSSVIINIQSFKMDTQNSFQKLNQNLNNFLKQFNSQQLSEEQNRNQLLSSIFPKVFYKVTRQNFTEKTYKLNDVKIEEFFLENAKNPSYRGDDNDLRIHSFMNKKCINQGYIQKVSQIFSKVVKEIRQKKHRELVFNGGIIKKYLEQLSMLKQKSTKIDIRKVYYDIVQDLYLSAYNYSVICYHQALQEALSDQKPRSLDELLNIFDLTSTQIFQKFNQFNLEHSIHQHYEQKLQTHIHSKQKLILQINKKKTHLQLNRISQSLNFDDFTTIIPQIQTLGQKYPNYTHGNDETIAPKVAEALKKLFASNNVDYRLINQIQKLNQSLQNKNHQLKSLRQSNEKKFTQANKKQQEKIQLVNIKNQKDKQIERLKRQIKSLQNLNNTEPTQFKQQQKQLLEIYDKNQNILQQLRRTAVEPVGNIKQIKELEKRIQEIRGKIRSQQMTLKALQSGSQANKNSVVEKGQTKQKKQQNTTVQNTKQTKSNKKSGK